ncbi:MAG: hypothetical protein A2201_12710 [Alicyclobacillus sp. RIFOXYA1_FULL_53_8]|nr:MAG: hypothetical protein A2201_12710 [Alicyclobacillus sp. RIFOXYA1_FULL_53_8]
MILHRGYPLREINGLPYSIHQIGVSEWQVVIQNCTRHPAGYTFAPVYGSYAEAMQSLTNWPERDIFTTYDEMEEQQFPMTTLTAKVES